MTRMLKRREKKYIEFEELKIVIGAVRGHVHVSEYR